MTNSASTDRTRLGQLGQRLRPLGTAVTRHKSATAVVAALAVAGISGGVALAGHGGETERHVARTGQTHLLAPKDGDLVVSGTEVAQMKGACDGSSCYYVPPADPVVVHGRTGKTLPVHAEQSERFTAAVVDLAHTAKPVQLGVNGERLDLGQVPSGRYLVTLQAASGGSWQFKLVVDPKH